MPIISVRVDDAVRQGLEDLKSEEPKIGRRRIYNVALKIKTRLRQYPPPPEKSKYIRTYRLRDSVRVNSLENGYSVKVDPVSPKGIHYGKYPLGSAYGTDQAWMHKGRWTPMRDVVDQEVAKLPDDVRDEILLVARRKGLETA